MIPGNPLINFFSILEETIIIYVEFTKRLLYGMRYRSFFKMFYQKPEHLLWLKFLI